MSAPGAGSSKSAEGVIRLRLESANEALAKLKEIWELIQKIEGSSLGAGGGAGGGLSTQRFSGAAAAGTDMGGGPASAPPPVSPTDPLGTQQFAPQPPAARPPGPVAGAVPPPTPATPGAPYIDDVTGVGFSFRPVGQPSSSSHGQSAQPPTGSGQSATPPTPPTTVPPGVPSPPDPGHMGGFYHQSPTLRYSQQMLENWGIPNAQAYGGASMLPRMILASAQPAAIAYRESISGNWEESRGYRYGASGARLGGAAIGGLIGTFAIPVPYVGTAIGATIGGIAGDSFAQGLDQKASTSDMNQYWQVVTGGDQSIERLMQSGNVGLSPETAQWMYSMEMRGANTQWVTSIATATSPGTTGWNRAANWITSPFTDHPEIERKGAYTYSRAEQKMFLEGAGELFSDDLFRADPDRIKAIENMAIGDLGDVNGSRANIQKLRSGDPASAGAVLKAAGVALKNLKEVPSQDYGIMENWKWLDDHPEEEKKFKKKYGPGWDWGDVTEYRNKFDADANSGLRKDLEDLIKMKKAEMEAFNQFKADSAVAQLDIGISSSQFTISSFGGDWSKAMEEGIQAKTLTLDRAKSARALAEKAKKDGNDIAAQMWEKQALELEANALNMGSQVAGTVYGGRQTEKAVAGGESRISFETSLYSGAPITRGGGSDFAAYRSSLSEQADIYEEMANDPNLSKQQRMQASLQAKQMRFQANIGAEREINNMYFGQQRAFAQRDSAAFAEGKSGSLIYGSFTERTEAEADVQLKSIQSRKSVLEEELRIRKDLTAEEKALLQAQISSLNLEEKRVGAAKELNMSKAAFTASVSRSERERFDPQMALMGGAGGLEAFRELSKITETFKHDITAAQKHLDFVKGKYGEDTPEYREAYQQLMSAKRTERESFYSQFAPPLGAETRTSLAYGELAKVNYQVFGTDPFSRQMKSSEQLEKEMQDQRSVLQKAQQSGDREAIARASSAYNEKASAYGRSLMEMAIPVTPLEDVVGRSTAITKLQISQLTYAGEQNVRGAYEEQLMYSRKEIERLQGRRSALQEAGKLTPGADAQISLAINSATVQAAQAQHQLENGWLDRLISQAYNTPSNGMLSMSAFTRRESAMFGDIYHMAFGGRKDQMDKARQGYSRVLQDMGGVESILSGGKTSSAFNSMFGRSPDAMKGMNIAGMSEEDFLTGIEDGGSEGSGAIFQKPADTMQNAAEMMLKAASMFSGFFSTRSSRGGDSLSEPDGANPVIEGMDRLFKSGQKRSEYAPKIGDILKAPSLIPPINAPRSPRPEYYGPLSSPPMSIGSSGQMLNLTVNLVQGGQTVARTNQTHRLGQQTTDKVVTQQVGGSAPTGVQ